MTEKFSSDELSWILNENVDYTFFSHSFTLHLAAAVARYQVQLKKGTQSLSTSLIDLMDDNLFCASDLHAGCATPDVDEEKKGSDWPQKGAR